MLKKAILEKHKIFWKGCSSALAAQGKYLARHNGVVKILFFELLCNFKLIEETPPWYLKTTPKPEYHNERASAFWDVPLFAEINEVRANRIDARIVDGEARRVTILEMTCPWFENRAQKKLKKTRKYASLRWELSQQFPGYGATQHHNGFLGRGPLYYVSPCSKSSAVNSASTLECFYARKAVLVRG